MSYGDTLEFKKNCAELMGLTRHDAHNLSANKRGKYMVLHLDRFRPWGGELMLLFVVYDMWYIPTSRRKFTFGWHLLETQKEKLKSLGWKGQP